MKKLSCILLLSVLSGTAGDLSGKWDVVATPEGKSGLNLDADLKHEGADLTGTVNSSMGSGPVKNAVINGNDVTFQFMLGKYTFDVKAVSAGEGLRGTFSGPRNMKGEFVAKRVNGIPGAAVMEKAAQVQPAVEGVEVGVLGKAAYRIDIPKNYNGQLVVYAHGYSAAPPMLEKEKAPTPLMKAFLDLGFAFAQSAYSAGGWAVKEGVEDTEALRKHFVAKYGQPKRTFITGHSMGGTITVASIEQYPEAYDGALQMCGPTGATIDSFHRGLFDTLVVYDYYFPGVLGSPVEFGEHVLPGSEFVQMVQKEATQYPDRMMAFQKWSGYQDDTETATVVAFYALMQKELMARAGGNAFDNRNTIYQGSPNDAALNRGVKRYEANPQAVAYLKKYYTPTGELKKPMISLHTTYDPLVRAWSANAYWDIVRRNGSADLYVQRFVGRSGHCAFTPAETANAFRDLLKWQETGVRPAAGEQK